MEITKLKAGIMKILLKDISVKHNITGLAVELGMSRVGIWKILKKLEKENMILLSKVGSGKTSTNLIALNWENSLVEKILALALAEDAQKNQKWLENFRELEGKAEFVLIFGSIINSPKGANDIDIMIIAKKDRLLHIDELIQKIQKTQQKKIHAILITSDEFKTELETSNRAYLDGIKKGIFIFGQENFINLIKANRLNER